MMMSPWLYTVCTICLAAMFASAALCMCRLIVGPNAGDRAVALDTLSSAFVGILCILCVMWGSTLYFDAVWVLTLVGFLGSAAIAKYMLGGRVMR